MIYVLDESISLIRSNKQESNNNNDQLNVLLIKEKIKGFKKWLNDFYCKNYSTPTQLQTTFMKSQNNRN